MPELPKLIEYESLSNALAVTAASAQSADNSAANADAKAAEVQEFVNQLSGTINFISETSNSAKLYTIEPTTVTNKTVTTVNGYVIEYVTLTY